MKNNKVVIGGIVIASIISIISIIIGLYAKAQWFDDGNFLTTKTIKADAVYRISAAGGDMRMYIQTPPTDPYMRCIVFAGERNSTSTCYRKENYVATDKK